MDYPTVSVMSGAFGEKTYCVTYRELTVFHRQQWQCEALLQQRAADSGIELPAEWFRNQLGFRSRPQA
jgi:hypothetical protein